MHLGQFAATEAALEGDKYDPKGIGYALSGGGYKAAAFHLGGLIRLNELGMLPKIERISSVSGGSIAAGLLGVRWKGLQFGANGVAANFNQQFVDPLKEFLTEVNLDVYTVIGGLLDPFSSAAEKVAKGYRKHLVGDATLQDLPDEASAPRFTMVSTNYELNSLWRFSRSYAADYRVGAIDKPTFRVGDIIAASSAFPPVFCPLELNLKGQTVKPYDVDLPERFKARALLCDGGIYDNMGLEPVWKRYGVLLVSNAGDPMSETERPTRWDAMMLRITGMMHRQAENNRVRTLMLLAGQGRRTVGYWPLRNTGVEYPARSDLPPLSQEEIVAAQTEDVRLWSLGERAFRRLANHGYYLADCALRSYIPGANPQPAGYPFPTG